MFRNIYKSVAASRERRSRRATEALRTTPSSVASVVGSVVGSVVASVAEILSQQVGGMEFVHWSGAM